MTSRKELKSIAKQSLSGKWGFSIALLLIIFLLPSVLNFIPLLGALVVLVITPAISYVPQEFFLKVKKNEDVKIGDVFSAIFGKLGTYWGIALRTFLKLLPSWLIMMVGSFLTIYSMAASSPMVTEPMSSTTASLFSALGAILSLVGSILLFINSLYYVLAIYVKAENPNMTCKDAVLKSRELMTGHRMDYFVLCLSFIGWTLVGAITLGIAFFYVMPYMYTTFATFYESLKESDYTVSENNEVVQF